MKRKHVLSLLTALLASCDGAPPSNPPAPYTPPAGGAPRCELSADCPAGTHCDLGECIQDCSTANACSHDDQACTSRGRCVGDLKFDHDPPPSTSNGVVLEAPPIRIDDGVDTALLAIDATPANADVRYRVDPRVTWLHVPGAERGDFKASLRQMLTVDRKGLGGGNHDGTIVVHTSAGDVTIPVTLVVGLSGAYEGSTNYTAPRALGQAPIHLDLIADGANVKVRVDSSRSPLFPGRSGRVVAATASWDGQLLKGSLLQKLTPFDLGGDRFLDRDIGREFSFELRTTSAGGLAGTFSERWVGILPQAFSVTGTMTLARLDTAVMPFDVGTADLLPPDPPVNAPAVSAACSSIGWTADVFRAYGAQLDNPVSGLLVGDTNRGYAPFVDKCTTDVANNDLQPAIAQCFHSGNLICAHALYARTNDDAAKQGMAGLVSDRAGVGLLLVNDALVQAFQAAYDTTVDDGAVIPKTLANLDNARVQALATLRWSFDPHLLANLDTLSPTLAMADDYRPLRRLALVVGRHRQASEERGTIELRNLGTDPQALSQELADQAINLLVASATIAELERAEMAPEKAELGMLGDAMTALTKQFRALAASGGDPFGFPPGYVEYLYDPAAASGDRTTNFGFVYDSASRAMSRALGDEMAATNAVRANDTTAATVQNNLNDLAETHAVQLVQICGAVAGSDLAPDVANCGLSTGDMKLARDHVDQARGDVDVAMSRIQGLHDRVQIEVQRLQTVDSIRREDIAFTDQTGQSIDALTEDENEISMFQDIIHTESSFFGVLGDLWPLNWGNLPKDFGGAVSQLEDTEFNDIKRQIELQKQELLQAQQLHTLESNRQAEYVNGMAAIQEMLVQGAELNLELAQAKLRVIQSVDEVAGLFQRVRTLQADEALRASQATDASRGHLNDPAIRVIAEKAVADAMVSREVALKSAYAAGRAFEFEINWSFPAIATQLVPARRVSTAQSVLECMRTQLDAFHAAFHVPQIVVDEISLREHVLGIKGAVRDPVTGEDISEAEQFRRRLLLPSNIGPEGTVGMTFAMALDAGNGVLSTGVCNDQVNTISVKLVGDGLGDAQARVKMGAGGAALQRSCTAFTGAGGDVINQYKQEPTEVEMAAGVNTYPMPADAQLFGRAMGMTEWRIAIPPGSAAPQNADVDLSKIEDIVLRIQHAAISLSSTSQNFNPICQ